MPLIDRQGRVFGRLSIVDAAVVLLLVLSVPVAYGAYRLLHDPAPSLTAIDPTTVPMQKGTRIKLRGHHFKTLLRVVIGSVYADPFLVEGSTQAEVPLPALTPGSYDVALYDQGELLTRLPRALTVEAPAVPSVIVQVVGAFTMLDDATARQIKPDAAFGEGADPIATVLAVKPAEPAARRVRFGDALVATTVRGKVQVPAIVRLRCTVVGDECTVGDTVVAANVPIALPTANGALAFLVDELRSEDAPLVFPARHTTGAR